MSLQSILSPQSLQYLKFLSLILSILFFPFHHNLECSNSNHLSDSIANEKHVMCELTLSHVPYHCFLVETMKVNQSKKLQLLLNVKDELEVLLRSRSYVKTEMSCEDMASIDSYLK